MSWRSGVSCNLLKCFGSSLASHTKAVIFLGVFHLGNNCTTSHLRTRFLSCIRMCRDTFTSVPHCFSPGPTNASRRVGGKGSPPPARVSAPVTQAPRVPSGPPCQGAPARPPRVLGDEANMAAPRASPRALTDLPRVAGCRRGPGSKGRPLRGAAPGRRPLPHALRASRPQPARTPARREKLRAKGWGEPAAGRSATPRLASTAPRDLQP